MINTEFLTLGINFFLFVPVIGFLVSLFLPSSNEHALSVVSFVTAGLTLVSAIIFTVLWGINGFETLNLNEFLLYGSADYFFLIDLRL